MGNVMKTKFVRVAVVLMCFSLFTGICGCRKTTQKQDSVQFASLSQNQRINFVEEYLKAKYGLETDISEVEKKHINAFSSEQMYYAIAKCEDGARIYCWVDEKGAISDSKFLNDLQEPINRLFAEKISDKLTKYQVVCSCTLRAPASAVWQEDQIEQMLSGEDISVSVRIFVEHSEKTQAEELVKNRFDGLFSFASGNCYVYFVESAQADVISNTDLTKYDRSFAFEKDLL